MHIPVFTVQKELQQVQQPCCLVLKRNRTDRMSIRQPHIDQAASYFPTFENLFIHTWNHAHTHARYARRRKPDQTQSREEMRAGAGALLCS
ncbi:hypothetical protein VTL71DRAFT_5494 [Oculimacula yallundae]|uniref:Uncharacterized protein n=1 Tax=Oculimacula yallundae TaxID=86028 RepID=A0ABR4C1C7_9HELO